LARDHVAQDRYDFIRLRARAGVRRDFDVEDAIRRRVLSDRWPRYDNAEPDYEPPEITDGR